MLKLQKLLKIKDNREDRLIKLKDRNSLKESNNTKQTMPKLNNKKSLPEEMLKLVGKFMFQLLLKLPLLLESEVSINSILVLSEYLEFSD